MTKVKYQFRVSGGTFDHISLGEEDLGGKLFIMEDDSVRIAGVEYGKDMTLHYQGGAWVVVKVPGQQWYLNQYQGQQYAPAQFLVFQIMSLGGMYPDKAYGHIKHLFDFPAKGVKK